MVILNKYSGASVTILDSVCLVKKYLGVCVDIAVRVEDWDYDPVEHVHEMGVGRVGHQLPQYECHRCWTDPLPGVA